MAKNKENNLNKNVLVDSGKINFVKQAPMMIGISAFLLILSLVIILTKGFSFGIDFAGGIEAQVKFKEAVEADHIREFAESKMGVKNAVVQSYGADDEYLIRFEAIKGNTESEINEKNKVFITKLKSELSSSLPLASDGILRVDSVGPQIGNELKQNGLLSIFYSLILLLIYVGLRFDYRYAPGAVLCLFHDAVITLGIFSLFSFEVNVQIMAAILTIIGYSLNDTIVTFDRIRENEEGYKGKLFDLIVNRSINDVLSRTILTSVTTLLAVICMYILAGGVIKDFAFTLAIGVIIGTYSSIYIASPVLIFIDKYFKEKKIA